MRGGPVSLKIAFVWIWLKWWYCRPRRKYFCSFLALLLSYSSSFSALCLQCMSLLSHLRNEQIWDGRTAFISMECPGVNWSDLILITAQLSTLNIYFQLDALNSETWRAEHQHIVNGYDSLQSECRAHSMIVELTTRWKKICTEDSWWGLEELKMTWDKTKTWQSPRQAMINHLARQA